jgi:prepilin-type N-terminal cleavage/methylation domain-containing protein
MHKNLFLQAGFSLIELSISLLIASILLTAAFEFQHYAEKASHQKITNQHIEEINIAIKEYVNSYGSLPCVASRTALPDTAGFGVSVNCASAAAPAGTSVVINGTGRKLFIGSVPTRSLNLSDDVMLDGYKNRFTMVVTAQLAVKATYAANIGGIEILDSASNQLLPNKDAAYAIISHGDDGAGALDVYGTQYKACSTVNLDKENCNNNAVFLGTSLHSYANNAGYFDDTVDYRTKGQLNILGITGYYMDKMDCTTPSPLSGVALQASSVNRFGNQCTTALVYSNDLLIDPVSKDPRSGVKLYDRDITAQGSGSLVIKASIPVRYGIYGFQAPFLASLYINGTEVSRGMLFDPLISTSPMGSNGGTGFVAGELKNITKGDVYKVEIFAFITQPIVVAADSPVWLGAIKLGDHDVDGVVEIMETFF